MPKQTHRRPELSIVTIVTTILSRRRPAVTRREYGALAVAFAALAGLEEPRLASLRLNLADRWACDEQERALKG